MNGTPVRTYRAKATRTVTIASFRAGGVLDVVEGQEFEVTADSYGNTYVYDADGREFFLPHLVEVAS